MAGRILILEDEHIIATDLAELISGQGYEVAVAHSYNEGLSTVEAGFLPQLLLCDIQLEQPEDGIRFAKWIREQHAETEIIFITGYPGQGIIEKTALSEPLNFIVKPWNEQQICVTVQIAFNYIRQKAKTSERLSVLSLTEYRIIELIAANKSSREIGALLFITEKTVRNHRYNISKKLDLPNEKNSLLKWAMQHL